MRKKYYLSKKTFITNHPPGEDENSDEGMEAVELNIPPPRLMLTEQFYEASLFPNALLKEIMLFYGAKPLNTAYVESLDLEENDRNI